MRYKRVGVKIIAATMIAGMLLCGAPVKSNAASNVQMSKASISSILKEEKTNVGTATSIPSISKKGIKCVSWNPNKDYIKVKWDIKGKSAVAYRVKICSLTGKTLNTYTVKKESVKIKKKSVLKAVRNKGFIVKICPMIKNGKKTVLSDRWTSKTIIPQAETKVVKTTKKSVTIKWPTVENVVRYNVTIVYGNGANPDLKVDDVQEGLQNGSLQILHKVFDGDVTGVTTSNIKKGNIVVVPIVKKGNKEVKGMTQYTYYTYFETK